MPLVRRLLPLTATLLLAIPATAAAQGAADNQYSDPFGNSPPPSTSAQHTSTPKHVVVVTQSTGSVVAATPAPTSSGTAALASSSTTTSDPSSALPRTGFDAGEEALIGAALLLLGVTVRLRTRKPSR